MKDLENDNRALAIYIESNKKTMEHVESAHNDRYIELLRKFKQEEINKTEYYKITEEQISKITFLEREIGRLEQLKLIPVIIAPEVIASITAKSLSSSR